MDTSRGPAPSLPSRRHRPGPATLLLAALLLGGCGGDAPGTADAPAPAATTTDSAGTGDQAEGTVLVISDFTFHVPDSVQPGAEVTVRNEDSVGHTVTSDEEGLFDVAVPPGQEVTLTVPDQAGDYPFHCTPHPRMTATLVVGG